MIKQNMSTRRRRNLTRESRRGQQGLKYASDKNVTESANLSGERGGRRESLWYFVTPAELSYHTTIYVWGGESENKKWEEKKKKTSYMALVGGWFETTYQVRYVPVVHIYCMYLVFTKKTSTRYMVQGSRSVRVRVFSVTRVSSLVTCGLWFVTDLRRTCALSLSTFYSFYYCRRQQYEYVYVIFSWFFYTSYY